MKEMLKEFLSKVDILKFFTVNAVLVAFLACVYTLLKKVIPIENKDAVMMLIGIVVGSVKTMIDYHYGSSKGSSDKSKVINAELKGLEDDKLKSDKV